MFHPYDGSIISEDTDSSCIVNTMAPGGLVKQKQRTRASAAMVFNIDLDLPEYYNMYTFKYM